MTLRDPAAEEEQHRRVLLDAARRAGTLVHRVSNAADPRGEAAGRGYQRGGPLLLRALRAERWGPVVEIYALP